MITTRAPDGANKEDNNNTKGTRNPSDNSLGKHGKLNTDSGAGVILVYFNLSTYKYKRHSRLV